MKGASRVERPHPIRLERQVEEVFAGWWQSWLPIAKIGDYVLVHVGFAISVVDETEAQQVFEYLRQMDDLAGPGDGNRQ